MNKGIKILCIVAIAISLIGIGGAGYYLLDKYVLEKNEPIEKEPVEIKEPEKKPINEKLNNKKVVYFTLDKQGNIEPEQKSKNLEPEVMETLWFDTDEKTYESRRGNVFVAKDIKIQGKLIDLKIYSEECSSCEFGQKVYIVYNGEEKGFDIGSIPLRLYIYKNFFYIGFSKSNVLLYGMIFNDTFNYITLTAGGVSKANFETGYFTITKYNGPEEPAKIDVNKIPYLEQQYSLINGYKYNEVQKYETCETIPCGVNIKVDSACDRECPHP